MFPNIYYLSEPMEVPSRCFDGAILIAALDGHIQVKIEGNILQEQDIYLINHTELFEIQSGPALLFYIPGTIFKQLGINIYDHTYVLRQHEHIKHELAQLLQYYQMNEQQSHAAQTLLKQLLTHITLETKPASLSSNDILNHIIQYVSKHVYKRITLEELSHIFYMSSSTILSLFKTHMHVTFHQYITSLRIARSMTDVTSDKKIETIARDWGYSNATNYIMHFKKYMGVTPKKYKSFPIKSKQLRIANISNDYEVLSTLTLDTAEKKQQVDIVIDDQKIQEPSFHYFNLIDIGSYDNIDAILNEPVFDYKNFSNYKLSSYIYISEAEEIFDDMYIQDNMSEFRKLLRSNISVALKINSIEYYQYVVKIIEALHFLESEHFASSVVQSANLLLLVDLDTITLDELHRIKRSAYGANIRISIDISHLYNQKIPIVPEIRTLNPEYYTIDFNKITLPVSREVEDLRALQKDILHYFEQIGARNNIIFLDYDIVYQPALTNNIARFLHESLKSRQYIAGASIGFTSNGKKQHPVTIFNAVENKTLFYFLGTMLMNFSRFPCEYGDGYLITKNLHSYNVLLYNTDATFTQRIDEYTKSFSIQFSEPLNKSEVLISKELLNNYYGTIYGIVNPEINDAQNFPDHLKYKLSQHNNPLLKIDKHNFNDMSFIAKVPPKSIVLITIYH